MKHNTIKKISQEEISRNQVEGNLPDKPSQAPLYGGRTLTPEEIKGFFDKLPKLIAERYNEIATAVHNGEFDGKSAYQYAVEYGYEGSEEEFGLILADLKTYKEYTDQHLLDHDEAIAELQGDNEQLYMIADELVAMNETTAKRVDFCEKRITNLEKGLPADRFVTDDSVAYVKRIPTNACPYAAVEKVGGMTKRSDNLIPYPYPSTTTTHRGVTYTDNGDGTITVNGTADAQSYFILYRGTFPAGTYTLSGIPYAVATAGIYFSNDNYTFYYEDRGKGATFTSNETGRITIAINLAAGTTVNNFIVSPMLNKDTSAKPFERYHEGIRNANVTAIESKDASGNIIGQMDIPAEVQNLDGYGEGAGTASNYIDFESTQFVKKVHTIDLGTLNWEVQSTNRFVAYLPTDKIAKPTGSYKTAANAVCSKYDNLPQDTLYANKVGIAIQATAGTTVYVYDTTYTDATTFKSAMSGVTLCYELADEYVDRLDISDLITADNLIEVEGGGTLTFVNEHGAAAASTIEYQVKGAS